MSGISESAVLSDLSPLISALLASSSVLTADEFCCLSSVSAVSVFSADFSSFTGIFVSASSLSLFSSSMSEAVISLSASVIFTCTVVIFAESGFIVSFTFSSAGVGSSDIAAVIFSAFGISSFGSSAS